MQKKTYSRAGLTSLGEVRTLTQGFGGSFKDTLNPANNHPEPKP